MLLSLMYLEIQRHRSKPYGVLRSSYRKDGKVCHRNHGRLTGLDLQTLCKIRAALRSDTSLTPIAQLRTYSAREFGASSAILALARQLKLDRAIGNPSLLWVRCVLAMVIGKLIYSGSKLFLTNLFADTALWELLGVTQAMERPDVQIHCYEPMDELLAHQKRIQKKLAATHLSNGSVVLYDITSIYFHGEYESSDIVTRGKSKPDAPRGTKQVLAGLLCNSQGCPVGVEIFRGNKQEAQTLEDKIKEIRKRYGIKELVFIGDRGIITQANYEVLKEKKGLSMITALTHPQILQLIDKGVVQMELFNEEKIGLVTDPKNEDRKFHLCCNPKRREAERVRRKELLGKVEERLTKIKEGAEKRRATEEEIGSRVGKVFGKYKLEKFIEWKIINVKVGKGKKEGKGLSWEIDREKIEREEKIDGCYVIASDALGLGKEETVKAYRSLSCVEQAFRSLKRVQLDIQPVYHHRDERIEAHVLICMLSYYLMWHMKERLGPLFEEDGKHLERRWSFGVVLERLKGIRKCKASLGEGEEKIEFDQVDSPDEEQQKILDLLKIKLAH